MKRVTDGKGERKLDESDLVYVLSWKIITVLIIKVANACKGGDSVWS